jgi:hypothetical protein
LKWQQAQVLQLLCDWQTWQLLLVGLQVTRPMGLLPMGLLPTLVPPLLPALLQHPGSQALAQQQEQQQVQGQRGPALAQVCLSLWVVRVEAECVMLALPQWRLRCPVPALMYLLDVKW